MQAPASANDARPALERVGLMRGIWPPTAEACFQAEQARAVVWVRTMERCPPLLALLFGKRHAKVLKRGALAAHMGTLSAILVCLWLLRPQGAVELPQAFMMSGWCLYLTSSVMLELIPFDGLFLLGSLLVAGAIVVNHSAMTDPVRAQRSAAAALSCHPPYVCLN